MLADRLSSIESSRVVDPSYQKSVCSRQASTAVTEGRKCWMFPSDRIELCLFVLVRILSITVIKMVGNEGGSSVTIVWCWGVHIRCKCAHTCGYFVIRLN